MDAECALLARHGHARGKHEDDGESGRAASAEAGAALRGERAAPGARLLLPGSAWGRAQRDSMGSPVRPRAPVLLRAFARRRAGMTVPAVSGLLETALYVDDVPRSERFYRDLFGFETLSSDERFCALN